MTNFNINSLEGATFTTDALFGVTAGASYNATNHYAYVPRGANPKNPGGSYTVTVANTHYIAPTSSSLAIFGEIELTQDFGNHLVTYASIIGYTSNALLLSGFEEQSSNFADPAHPEPEVQSFPGRYVTIGHAYVLSDVTLTASTFPMTFSDKVPYTPPPCFAKGTRIRTDGGETAVEALAVGDRVVTASGAVRPVTWIGNRRINVAAHPVADEVNPILIRAGAFAPGAPSRDLRLSPGHAVAVDGVLVPAGRLVNGATIVQEAVATVHYFHLELESHDVVLAEGLTCETYLDDGNRAVFANVAGPIDLHGRLDTLDWSSACAPVVRDGDHLAEIQGRLHARAAALGWVKTFADDLKLVADGAQIAPLRAAGSRLWFCVPAAQSLTLVSKAARPCDLTPGETDARRLGVAIQELRVDGRVLDLDESAFGAGFLPVEREGEAAWRWTDGAATLNLSGPAMVEVALHMVVQSWTRPAAAYLRLVQVA